MRFQRWMAQLGEMEPSLNGMARACSFWTRSVRVSGARPPVSIGASATRVPIAHPR